MCFSFREIMRTPVTCFRWSKVTRTPIVGTKLGVDDLIEGEEYEFRVLAVNEAGTGKPSLGSGPIKIKDPYGKIFVILRYIKPELSVIYRL